MTIYAIVNPLLSSPEKITSQAPVWTLISQAAILQGGNPFFVPDFASSFEARIALAIKIGKLGKGIAPRFAHRYIDSAAPALLFVATDLLESLKSTGRPWSQAISYDRSLAIGKFTNLSLEDCKSCMLAMSMESTELAFSAQWSADSLSPGIEETIAAVSSDNTLKMGDIILIGIADSGPQVNPEMRIHLYFNNSESLAFNIR